MRKKSTSKIIKFFFNFETIKIKLPNHRVVDFDFY